MRWVSIYGAVLLVIGIGLVGTEAQAVMTLTLSSTAKLSELPVGGTTTFNVNLSGLAGHQLGALDVAVAFTDHLKASNVTWGGIVPVSGNLDSYADDKEASASFSANGGEYISGEGLCFSFNTSIEKAGAGTLSISYAYATQVDPTVYLDSSNTNQIICSPAIGSSLGFTAVTVPEPSTLAMFAAAALTAFVCLLKRRMSFTRS